MKMKVVSLLFVMLLSLSLQAQNNMSEVQSSLEISIGPSTLFIGDIGNPFEDKYFFDTSSQMHDSLKLINSSISLGFHQEINKKFAYKISIHSAAYERQKSPTSPNAFLTNVFELMARGEYTIYRKIRPQESHVFIHAGLGVLYSSYVVNPPATVSVEPTTIGAPVIPVGLGYRFYLTDKFKVGADVNIHYVFCDFVEGRGFPKVTTGLWPQDVLANVSLTASYAIFAKNKRNGKCRCEWY